MSNFEDDVLKLLRSKPEPVKIGNGNKSGECGMCGIYAKKLYPQRVGNVDFMICANCKSIMDM